MLPSSSVSYHSSVSEIICTLLPHPPSERLCSHDIFVLMISVLCSELCSPDTTSSRVGRSPGDAEVSGGGQQGPRSEKCRPHHLEDGCQVSHGSQVRRRPVGVLGRGPVGYGDGRKGGGGVKEAFTLRENVVNLWQILVLL